MQFARSDVDPISSMNVLNDVKQEIEDLGYDAVIDQIISWCFLGGKLKHKSHCTYCSQ